MTSYNYLIKDFNMIQTYLFKLGHIWPTNCSGRICSNKSGEYLQLSSKTSLSGTVLNVINVDLLLQVHELVTSLIKLGHIWPTNCSGRICSNKSGEYLQLPSKTSLSGTVLNVINVDLLLQVRELVTSLINKTQKGGPLP